MFILKYSIKIIFISIIYYSSILVLYYSLIKFKFLPNLLTDLLHNSDYAPSISFIMLILLPIIIIPNLTILTNNIDKKKVVLSNTYKLNILFISLVPITTLLFFNIPMNNPIFLNIIIIQLVSIIINTLFFKFFKIYN
tara:strand:+ start:56 stop:469 length:414 start_codon:yes stop_codon:yes gene_type:complete